MAESESEEGTYDLGSRTGDSIPRRVEKAGRNDSVTSEWNDKKGRNQSSSRNANLEAISVLEKSR